MPPCPGPREPEAQVTRPGGRHQARGVYSTLETAVALEGGLRGCRAQFSYLDTFPPPASVFLFFVLFFDK